ncbi:hypothetical protein SDC9_162138 [bioreactor metagenome]|uniref:Uncharacterized protein n=1 Tax=bioreactor metagenome TaxID=1076179 RepID=A0A645FN93_9ZZZZ
MRDAFRALFHRVAALQNERRIARQSELICGKQSRRAEAGNHDASARRLRAELNRLRFRLNKRLDMRVVARDQPPCRYIVQGHGHAEQKVHILLFSRIQRAANHANALNLPPLQTICSRNAIRQLFVMLGDRLLDVRHAQFHVSIPRLIRSPMRSLAHFVSR